MQIYDRFKSNPFRFWASVTNTNRPIAADSLNNHILNANDANGRFHAFQGFSKGWPFYFFRSAASFGVTISCYESNVTREIHKVNFRQMNLDTS